jgi:hypothetical protein
MRHCGLFRKTRIVRDQSGLNSALSKRYLTSVQWASARLEMCVCRPDARLDLPPSRRHRTERR